MILTTTEGQAGLPRYFAQVFAMLQRMNQGRLDLLLPDGRHFRAEGAEPGPVAEVHIHDDDVFARLIREGELGFADAYLDESWSTPDLPLLTTSASIYPMSYHAFSRCSLTLSAASTTRSAFNSSPGSPVTKSTDPAPLFE